MQNMQDIRTRAQLVRYRRDNYRHSYGGGYDLGEVGVEVSLVLEGQSVEIDLRGLPLSVFAHIRKHYKLPKAQMLALCPPAVHDYKWAVLEAAAGRDVAIECSMGGYERVKPDAFIKLAAMATMKFYDPAEVF